MCKYVEFSSRTHALLLDPTKRMSSQFGGWMGARPCRNDTQFVFLHFPEPFETKTCSCRHFCVRLLSSSSLSSFCVVNFCAKITLPSNLLTQFRSLFAVGVGFSPSSCPEVCNSHSHSHCRVSRHHIVRVRQLPHAIPCHPDVTVCTEGSSQSSQPVAAA